MGTPQTPAWAMIPVVGPFIAPIAANAAQQGVLIATGDQSRFSWKSFGITALNTLLFGPGGSNFGTGASRAGDALRQGVAMAAQNAVTQGIANVVGLQKGFSWSGVATAGLSGGLTSRFGGNLNTANRGASVARQIGFHSASGIASAAVTSLITGTSFGDNLVAALPQIVSQTIGGVMGVLKQSAAAGSSRWAQQVEDGAVAGGEGAGGGVAGGGWGSALQAGGFDPVREFARVMGQAYTGSRGSQRAGPVTPQVPDAGAKKLKTGSLDNFVAGDDRIEADPFDPEVRTILVGERGEVRISGPGRDSVRSSYIGRKTGVLRILEGPDGSTAYFNGQTERFDNLGITVSYVADRNAALLERLTNKVFLLGEWRSVTSDTSVSAEERSTAFWNVPGFGSQRPLTVPLHLRYSPGQNALARGWHQAPAGQSTALDFFRPSTPDEIARVIRGTDPNAPFNASQPSTVRSWVIQRRLVDGFSGYSQKISNIAQYYMGEGTAYNRYVVQPGRVIGSNVYRYTLGPGTLIGNFNDGTWQLLGAVADSPLGDPQVAMFLAQPGPGGIVPEAQTGLRWLVTAYRASRTVVPIAAESGASNIATAPKLAEHLRLESARSPFTSNGQLTPQAIQDSRMIIPNSQIGNPRVPSGYNKYSTPTFQSPSGDFQTHFYMNPKTGNVIYDLDYKIKLNK